MDKTRASVPQNGIRLLRLPPRFRFPHGILPRLRQQEQGRKKRPRDAVKHRGAVLRGGGGGGNRTRVLRWILKERLRA